ncbi:uncharacterized protein LOC136033109 isoform X2 [Artemia franciscana]|uniref:uncharacterized protein LOC136033109 isoform X2 n=1 Tax=Artemia franciscana TaxID=6661 RepID=UPI0032DBF2D2
MDFKLAPRESDDTDVSDALIINEEDDDKLGLVAQYKRDCEHCSWDSRVKETEVECLPCPDVFSQLDKLKKHDGNKQYLFNFDSRPDIDGSSPSPSSLSNEELKQVLSRGDQWEKRPVLISNSWSNQITSVENASCFSSSNLPDTSGEDPHLLKTKFYRCSHCQYITHVKARFTKHVKYHSMPTIKCDLCDFKTPYKWNLDRHLKNHTGTGIFKCTQCNFTARIKQSLTVHTFNHHCETLKLSDMEAVDLDYSNSDSSKSEFNGEPLIPTTVEAIQTPEQPQKKKIRPVPNLIPISQITSKEPHVASTEMALQVMSFLDRLAERLAQSPVEVPKPEEIRPVSMTSSRCQFCRRRCKSRNDLVSHLKTCNLAISVNKETSKSIANEGNLDAQDYDDDDAVVGLETEPGHGMVCNAIVEGPTIIRRVYKCPSCSFWATTASRFHVHMVGHTNTKPFECSECRYRSNWRWDITKHIRLKALRDQAHVTASLILLDSSGERNYDQYDKYLTTMRVAAGAKDSTTTPIVISKRKKLEEVLSPEEPEDVCFQKHKKQATVPSPLSLIRGETSSTSSSPEPEVKQRKKNPKQAVNTEALTSVKNTYIRDKKSSEREEKDDGRSGTSCAVLPPGIMMDARRTIWKCKRCSFKHKDKRMVIAHMARHTRIEKFFCGICGKGSNWQSVVRRHCRLKHDGNIQVIENKVPDDETPELSHEVVTKLKPEKQKSTSDRKKDSNLTDIGLGIGESATKKRDQGNLQPIAVKKEEDDEKGFSVYPGMTHLICSYCPFVCKNFSEMDDHQIHHRREDFPLKCLICHYYTHSKEDLNQHHILHGVKPNGELTISLATPTVDQQQSAIHKQENIQINPDSSDGPGNADQVNVLQCQELENSHENADSFGSHRKDDIGEAYDIDIDPLSLPILSDSVTSQLSEIPLVWVSKDSKFFKLYKCRHCPFVESELRIIEDHEARHFVSDDYKFKCSICNLTCSDVFSHLIHTELHSYSSARIHAFVEPQVFSPLQQDRICEDIIANGPSPSQVNGISFNLESEENITSDEPLSVSELEKYWWQLVKNSIEDDDMVEAPSAIRLLSNERSDSVISELSALRKELSDAKQHKNFPISGLDLRKHLSGHNESIEGRCNTPSSFGALDGTKDPWLKGNPWYIYPTCKKNGKTKERRYKCPKCPSAFDKLDQYKVHIQLHGSQQKYKCTDCDYSVKYYANYLQHIKKHENHKQLLTEREKTLSEGAEALGEDFNCNETKV